MESVGHARALVSSTSDGLQCDTDLNWIADTGATSHMTPHQAWLRNYTPYVVPIQLADNTVVHSAGLGTVVLNLVVNGLDLQPVELTHILHVPSLRSNLISCLYLTKRKGIRLEVDDVKMAFKRDGNTLFTATITDDYSGILDVSTEVTPEFAKAVATLPMDINLWHRRCAHHSHATITKLVRGDLVTGLVMSGKSQPDPICEPCLAGKMTSGTFPTSDSHSLHPLELVHSDLHGPLPVDSPEGYCYWITFIDDCTKLYAVMSL